MVYKLTMEYYSGIKMDDRHLAIYDKIDGPGWYQAKRNKTEEIISLNKWNLKKKKKERQTKQNKTEINSLIQRTN